MPCKVRFRGRGVSGVPRFAKRFWAFPICSENTRVLVSDSPESNHRERTVHTQDFSVTSYAVCSFMVMVMGYVCGGASVQYLRNCAHKSVGL
jgi:hypothetical protein